MPDDAARRVTLVGSYVPRRCGIATFANNLALAIAGVDSEKALRKQGDVSVLAINDRGESYDYGNEVILQVEQHRRDAYRDAAEFLNTSRTQIVCLQHEYGLFGGEAGEYLCDLIARLRKPLVTTLHTVLTEPTPQQRDVLGRICERSNRVVVMANRARQILHDVNDVPLDRIELVHHGVPDLPLGDTEPFKQRFELGGRTVILTFGLLSPGKGIETMLDALAKVVPDHPDVAYIVLGVTHPGVRRESGEQYRMALETAAVRLGIQKNVLFHNRYVTNDDLGEYLQAADIYVTPYRAKEQITSGTLAYALAAGKPIVSTPYWHAEELLADGRGRLFDFGDSDDLARNLRELISCSKTRQEISRAAYEYGRQMTWPQVGRHYVEVFEQAKQSHTERALVEVLEETPLTRLSLPEPRMDHLFKMTDDTAMMQHAIYTTPDRRHGYCTDDNARALIVSAMGWSLFQDERVLNCLHIYLAFLHFAFRPDICRFRNFMSYDRSWIEQDGSDDSQGRALWALGYLTSHSPNQSDRQFSADLFRSALPLVDSLSYPRSWAFSILGLYYHLREFGPEPEVLTRIDSLAKRLDAKFGDDSPKDWPWFEDCVTYDNGRIPQALIIAGLVLDRPKLVKKGLGVLDWLLELQTAEEGHLSLIGNAGWLNRNGERAKYDQQPLEAAALIGACKAAYRVEGDARWLKQMRRCFEWYLGVNDGQVPLIDFKSRGCFDGLSAAGVNQNQGAESLLSWLLALLIMHEMQTGDSLDVA